jgi:hypothetical protein
VLLLDVYWFYKRSKEATTDYLETLVQNNDATIDSLKRDKV